MAELVDALVLGTNIFGCEGSSPFRPTMSTKTKKKGMVIKENL